MTTRKLYKDGDFIIVNEGSRKEKELMALGWHKEPKPSKAGKQEAGKSDAGKPEDAGKPNEGKPETGKPNETGNE